MRTGNAMRPHAEWLAPIVSSGFLLGIGMGAIVDGLVLSLVLQWHHMLSSVVPPLDADALRINLIGDGLFLALGCVMIAIGIARLWRAGLQPDVVWSARALGGGLAMGWGALVVVEGVVFHHVLGLHHVRAGYDQQAWDLGFLALGAAMVAIGAWTVYGREQALFEEGIPA